MSYLTGEILPPPALRFNYSSATVQHSNPRMGLRTCGPYDSSILGKDKINYAVIYPQSLRGIGNSLLTGLTKGHGGFS